MTCNRLHERFGAHRILLGLLQMRLNPIVVEIAGYCGYDFLLIDGEHGVFSESDYLETLRGLASTDVISMVRLANHDGQAMRRYLRMGADVIVAPHVSTAEQASELVLEMKSTKEEAGLIVIIESRLGVSNAEAIMRVKGVDGVLVGPNDLTEDLGCPKDYASPHYAEALSRIEWAASVTGKFLGTVPHTGYPLEALFSRGHRLFILGTDISSIREALSVQVSQARACLDNCARPARETE